MCIVIKRVDNILFIFNKNNNGYKSKIGIYKFDIYTMRILIFKLTALIHDR